MAGDAVLLAGDINVDNIFTVPELPVPGRDGLATHTEMHLGGAVCNSAVVLRKLGLEARLCGAVGEDQWADFVFDALDEVGVRRDFVVQKAEDSTGLIFIPVTPNGERTMFSYRGVNRCIAPEDVPPEALDGVGMLQVSGYVFLESPQRETAWHLIEAAEAREIPISLDSGLDPVLLEPEILRRTLPYLTLLITGTREAEVLTGETDLDRQTEALLALGIQQVALKLGSQGAHLAWQGGRLTGPAFPVTVKDTTSAGDAFSAGLIFGWLRDFPPEAALALANALGGLATTVYGAARIGRDEVQAFFGDLKARGEDGPYQPGLDIVLALLGG
jgi:ribokinase